MHKVWSWTISRLNRRFILWGLWSQTIYRYIWLCKAGDMHSTCLGIRINLVRSFANASTRLSCSFYYENEQNSEWATHHIDKNKATPLHSKWLNLSHRVIYGHPCMRQVFTIPATEKTAAFLRDGNPWKSTPQWVCSLTGGCAIRDGMNRILRAKQFSGPNKQLMHSRHTYLCSYTIKVITRGIV